MHEVGIMAEAASVAMDTATRAGAERVTCLRMRIGVLSGVVPEALDFAFEVACQQPMLRGARLEIESVPAACWCPVCRAEFECGDWIGECPTCHHVSGELRRGRELEIASVEIC